MKKKILVLGSSSFSGASLIDNLLTENKYLVFGTYRKRKKNYLLLYKHNKNINFFKNYKIDLSKKSHKLLNLVKKIKPNIILDFASICMVNESWKNPELYYQINVLSKIKTIQYLSTANFLDKYIYISTPEIFGSSSEYINEDCDSFKPKTPYASSKLSFEIFLKNYHKNFQFPLIISRFSNFYGPGQPLHRLIPKLISCIDSEKKFPLEGNGRSQRNFIYKDDFCNGIKRIILKGKIGKTYHFSGKNFNSVLDIIKNICKIKSYDQKKLIKKVKRRLGQDFLYKLDCKKTKKQLNWRPVYTLKSGLEKVLDYHNKYIKKISVKDMIYQDKNLKK